MRRFARLFEELDASTATGDTNNSPQGAPTALPMPCAKAR